jgi:hypothetical protein
MDAQNKAMKSYRQMTAAVIGISQCILVILYAGLVEYRYVTIIIVTKSSSQISLKIIIIIKIIIMLQEWSFAFNLYTLSPYLALSASSSLVPSFLELLPVFYPFPNSFFF